MNTKTKNILLWVAAVVCLALIFALVIQSNQIKIKKNLTATEMAAKDSLQLVLDQQLIAEAEAKVLAEKQAEAKKNLLQSTGLDKLQLPGIYWEWGADSSSISEGIKTFKLYDAERDNYPYYRWKLERLAQKTFGGSGEQSKRRSNSLVDLFVKAPQIFKVIYDLNKGIISKLKKDWQLPNQGEELAKYLRATKYPYDVDFESYFQKHTRDGSHVFIGDGWRAFYALCHTKYPETFKSENDLEREYGNWRVVSANFSPEAKSVLLYVLTDYNGGAAAQPATAADINKAISDWLK